MFGTAAYVINGRKNLFSNIKDMKLSEITVVFLFLRKSEISSCFFFWEAITAHSKITRYRKVWRYTMDYVIDIV